MKDDNFILSKDEIIGLNKIREKGIKRVAMEEGEKNGIKIGEKRGKSNALNETAKKMIKDKLDIDTIVRYTGLSKKQINQLEI